MHCERQNSRAICLKKGYTTSWYKIGRVSVSFFPFCQNYQKFLYILYVCGVCKCSEFLNKKYTKKSNFRCFVFVSNITVHSALIFIKT